MLNGAESRKVEITLNSAVSHVPTLQPILVCWVTFHLLCEVADLKHHSFNIALPFNRITRVQISASPAILQSKC